MNTAGRQAPRLLRCLLVAQEFPSHKHSPHCKAEDAPLFGDPGGLLSLCSERRLRCLRVSSVLLPLQLWRASFVTCSSKEAHKGGPSCRPLRGRVACLFIPSRLTRDSFSLHVKWICEAGWGCSTSHEGCCLLVRLKGSSRRRRESCKGLCWCCCCSCWSSSFSPCCCSSPQGLVGSTSPAAIVCCSFCSLRLGKLRSLWKQSRNNSLCSTCT